MQRALKILGELDPLSFRVANHKKQIAGARLSTRRRVEPLRDESIPYGLDIICLVAYVKQPGSRFVGNRTVKFDELVIVHLEVRHSSLAGIGECERLLETQLSIEATREGHILYAKGHVRNSGQRCALSNQRPRTKGEEDDAWQEPGHSLAIGLGQRV